MNKRDLWNSEYLQGNLPTSGSKTNMSTHVSYFINFLAANGIKQGMILDIGCGNGYDSISFANQGFIAHGFDISDLALNNAKKEIMRENKESQIHLLRMDAGAFWCFLSDSFDAAFDGTTLINLIKDSEINNYLRELKRILKNNAFAQIVTPILPDEFYRNLYEKQKSTTVICPTGIVQKVYSLDSLLCLFKEQFHIKDIGLIQKNNVMYGKEYERHLARIILQNEK